MLRIKLGLLVSVAWFAVIGVAANSAAGFEWWVKNESLEGKRENLAFTMQAAIELSTINFAIRCTQASSTGGFIRNKLEAQWTQLKLGTCTVPGKPECTVMNGELVVGTAEGLLELNGIIKAVHPAGTEFGSFTIEGAGCAIARAYTIKANGRLYLRLQQPEFETNPKVFELEGVKSSLIFQPLTEEVQGISGALTATAENFNYRVKNAGCA